MPDTKERLKRCFQTVFPERSYPGTDSGCQLLDHGGMDSVTTITLAAAVEEEFDIQLEPEEIEKMDSFAKFLNLLTARSAVR